MLKWYVYLCKFFQPVIGVTLVNELDYLIALSWDLVGHSHGKIIWVKKWRKRSLYIIFISLRFILSQCILEYSFSCNVEWEYWKQAPACQIKFYITSLSGAILLKCSTLSRCPHFWRANEPSRWLSNYDFWFRDHF